MIEIRLSPNTACTLVSIDKVGIYVCWSFDEQQISYDIYIHWLDIMCSMYTSEIKKI